MVGAIQGPSFVRIRWIDLVVGSIHAASRDSKVVKPNIVHDLGYQQSNMKVQGVAQLTRLNGFEYLLLGVQ